MIMHSPQGTSWEYVQFLWKANTLPAGAFLADEGRYFLDACISEGYTMGSV